MAVFEELETKMVNLPDGRILMLYRSCALGETHPAKGSFKAIIWSPSELSDYIFTNMEMCPDVPVVLRGKHVTCKDYGEYLERLKKRAVDWQKFAEEYPSMYAEETLGYKVHSVGRSDYCPPRWMGTGEFNSLWELHGGRGIIAIPDKTKTRDLEKITAFMKGKYDSENIRFILGKKKKAA